VFGHGRKNQRNHLAGVNQADYTNHFNDEILFGTADDIVHGMVSLRNWFIDMINLQKGVGVIR